MREKLAIIAQTLRLPSLCALCKQFHRGQLAVCDDCLNFLSPLGPNCRCCAYPLFDKHFPLCGQCIKKPPHFDRSYIAYKFEGPLRGLLHQFKYHNGLYLKNFFCHLIMQAYQEPKPECLIPVPMHPQRIRSRGFNQAAVLAKSLAKQLQIPCELYRCQKIINTESQASLDGVQRQKNLHHAFHIKKIAYQHVALIDDLLTTGATANELATVLKKSGVRQVDVWCCARAVRN